MVVVPTAYRALSVMVRYELYDKKANVVASASGAEMHNATLNVANVNPWWPVGMSDTPGYLYNLKVGAFGGTTGRCAIRSFAITSQKSRSDAILVDFHNKNGQRSAPDRVFRLLRKIVRIMA